MLAHQIKALEDQQQPDYPLDGTCLSLKWPWKLPLITHPLRSSIEESAQCRLSIRNLESELSRQPFWKGSLPALSKLTAE
ncbi:MAG: hypothetical protein R2875_16930 [Desulfobacterales bacterium]